jgi:hypothetical protein
MKIKICKVSRHNFTGLLEQIRGLKKYFKINTISYNFYENNLPIVKHIDDLGLSVEKFHLETHM